MSLIGYRNTDSSIQNVSAATPLPVTVSGGSTTLVNTINGTTGTTLPGSGIMGYDGTNYRRLLCDTAGRLITIPYNVFYNDTTTNLSGSATFTGTSRDLTTTPNANYFNATVYSSHVSGTAGFAIESSNDNSTWLVEAVATLVAATPLTLSVPITTRYYRVRLTNGGTGTSTLRINSSLTGA